MPLRLKRYNDNYFLKCQQRILHLLPLLSAIVPLVVQELENPSFQTRRWIVYRIQRKATSTLMAEAYKGNAQAIAVINEARRLADGKGTIESLKQVCLPIAEHLLKGNFLDDDALRFFSGRTESFVSALSMQLYVIALGEKSVTKA